MKYICVPLFIVIIITMTSFINPSNTTSEYDIEAFYSGIEPENNTMVLTSNDNLETAKLILVPMTIDIGNYSISITRNGSNLYKIDGKNIYIRTRYCYEYSSNQSVMLKVESQYGFSKGKITF